MSGRPRVLQICHDYKGPFRTIARQYAGYFPDCDVQTIFLRGHPDEQLADSIPGDVCFLRLEKDELRGLKFGASKKVSEQITGSPDLIIAHRYKPFYLAQQLNRRFNPEAVIGVMHEYGFLKRFGRSVYSRFWRRNVYLAGVSSPVSEEITRRNTHLEGRVFTLPHAIEAPVLHDAVTARHELGIPLGVFCFGFIGRFVAKKNLDVLIGAFAEGFENHGDTWLCLVGDGVQKDELMDLARSLGVADRVVFSGEKEDARRYMKAFDAFVLPSTHAEAFGLVLLEAMAASVPVISTDAPGPATVVGTDALLFRSGDTSHLASRMKELVSMPLETRDRMTEKALHRLGSAYSLTVAMDRIRTLPPVSGILEVEKS